MTETMTDIGSVSFSSVAIIGGGMGGLFTGALLAKLGYEVHVYEKNQIIGGGLQSFRREGVYFNPGMHNFGGFGEEWALSHIFRFLGIKDQLRVMPVDEKAQEIVWTDATHCYRLPRGRERFETYLVELFPNQAAGLHRYLDILNEVADSFDNFYMRPRAMHPEVKEYVSMKLLPLLRIFIDDEELIRLLSFLSPLCGNVPSDIPVPLYAMLSVLYLSGEYRFVDNSLQLANAMRGVIEAHGGEVVSGVEINQIKVQNAHVVDIADTEGRRYRADAYVAAITPKMLYAMTTEDVVRRVTIKRAENFETDKSVFSVYVKFRPDSFPFINSTIYIPIQDKNPNKPPYIVITTPPVSHQGLYAETMEILVPVFYETFAAWKDTKLHHRGEDYERTKKAMAKDIIEYVSNYYDIRSAIQNVYAATPLTVRDYYNNPGGTVFSQMGLNVPFITRTDNLFVTGQSVLFHGLCGVPLTAILTAEAVSGQDIMTVIRNIV
ncbi:MAG: NAD(P)/FAD-dependent oxidoreductase [Paludibacteraceae bacterium]|nr:NAD(P)/FAD-dependent oxidoreductase [Paludibacteraceae bacterium]